MSHHFIHCLRPTGLRAEYLPHVVPTTRHVVIRASLHFRVQSKSRRYGKVCGSNDDACFSIMNSLLLNKCINDTDFYTFEEKKNINYNYLFSYSEDNNNQNIYFFDIRSFKLLIDNNPTNIINPYN